MSGGQLPAYVDARRAFVQETELQGAVELSRIPRFAETLASDRAVIEVKLDFAVADNGQRTIQGYIKANCDVSCQRCLEPLAVSWEDEVALVLLDSEAQAKQLSGEWDPWIWTEPKMVLAELVEEQLLLSMPVVSYHSEESCADKLGYAPNVEVASEYPEADRENPFSVLKALKKSDGTD